MPAGHRRSDSCPVRVLAFFISVGIVYLLSFLPTQAQNIIVIKTLPGLASAACSALDSMRIDTLVGTLAGDDTAFLLMKDNTSADEFFHEIEKLL